MGRIKRLLNLRRLLTDESATVYIDEFAERYGVSLRTVQRDFALLKSDFGVPVVFDRRVGGYRWDPSVTPRPRERKARRGTWRTAYEVMTVAFDNPGVSIDEMARILDRRPSEIRCTLILLREYGISTNFGAGGRESRQYKPAVFGELELFTLLVGVVSLAESGEERLAQLAQDALERLLSN